MINPATVTAVPRPSSGTSPAPRSLVPFHHDDSFGFNKVDAFDHWRWPNNKNRAKVVNNDRTYEREEIQCPCWYGDAQEWVGPASAVQGAPKGDRSNTTSARWKLSNIPVKEGWQLYRPTVPSPQPSRGLPPTESTPKSHYSHSMESRYGCEGLKNRVTLFRINKCLVTNAIPCYYKIYVFIAMSLAPPVTQEKDTRRDQWYHD
ncbi:hypothetical protein F5148DRAFT_1369710 [Russula earlei]|uniref:Uncharacterized protein n=1 Tax=Russula earlei TaxID=71964 RepID=A0ACC0U0R3_9AGAM|nr:hypothetical protein F5148DRAFT_1369710 [Russula earlei]